KRGGDPSGASLAEALTQTMLNINQGTHVEGVSPIEEMMRTRNLYKLVYTGLARIYKSTQPQKALTYMAKIQDQEGRNNNDEFSQLMLRALKDELSDI
ncbi:MAG: hypothetical protein R3293_28220, partial [Candidatus Promineifilaceae bacterium]|nr:hypothetical protein [Candidatus Promineifilaceae bacterium]